MDRLHQIINPEHELVPFDWVSQSCSSEAFHQRRFAAAAQGAVSITRLG